MTRRVPPPAYDELAQVLHPTSALLYRLIWRACQRPEGVCRVALRDLAWCLRVAPSTVLLHARALLRAGYIAELNPGKHTHEYVISGKPVRRDDGRLVVIEREEAHEREH